MLLVQQQKGLWLKAAQLYPKIIGEYMYHKVVFVFVGRVPFVNGCHYFSRVSEEYKFIC